MIDYFTHGKNLVDKQFAVIVIESSSSSSFPAISLTADDTSDCVVELLELLVSVTTWAEGYFKLCLPELEFSHFPV
jgi:hypothetical protein